MSLAEQLKRIMEAQGLNVTEMAERIDIGRSALSQYINGKYGSDPTNIENKITAFIESTGTEVVNENEPANELSEEKPKIDVNRDFYKSEDVSMVLAVAKTCQDDAELGCVAGRSGYGKTYTLKKYAEAFDKVIYIECDCLMNCRDLITDIERRIGLPKGRGSSTERMKDIKKFFNCNKGYLIIVDEADKLISRDTIAKLEVLRSIFDQSNVGVLVAGELQLRSDIEKYDERFANRISAFWELRGLKRKEVEEYLEGLSITPKAVEELIVRANNTRNGCFRLLNRTMRNVTRIMGTDFGKKQITLDIITQASAMMLL